MSLKKYKIMIMDEVYVSITEIYDYIRYRLYARQAAENLLNRIFKAIDDLQYFPNSFFKTYKYNGKIKVRKVVVKNFVILYMVDNVNSIVYITDVMYGKRKYLNKRISSKRIQIKVKVK